MRDPPLEALSAPAPAGILGPIRVLLTTTAYPGHMLPMLPLARACAGAGHTVLIAGPGSRAALAADRGFDFHGVSEPAPAQLQELLASVARSTVRQGHARMIGHGFGRLATAASLPDVLGLVERWRPDLIVREGQEFAGALAADRFEIPRARVALGLAATEDQTIALAADAVDEQRAQLGLPADPLGDALRAEPAFSLVPELLEHPGGPAAVVHRFRVAEATPRRDAAGDGRAPAVYLSFGSVAATLGFYPRLYREAIDALACTGARLVVTVGAEADPRALGPVRARVRVERWLPQDAVLGDVDAVVCHGGYGSVIGALAYGVPVVTLPLFGGDHWANGRRLAQLGAGITLEGDPGAGRGMLDAPPADVLAALPDAVTRVLTEPGYRRSARRAATAVGRLPQVEHAVEVLKSVAAQPLAVHHHTNRR